MKTLRAMFVRFAGLFRRRQHEAETNEELRAHLDALTERNIAAGMSPDEAHYAVLRIEWRSGSHFSGLGGGPGSRDSITEERIGRGFSRFAFDRFREREPTVVDLLAFAG